MPQPALWTSLSSPYPLLLNERYPEHAAVAREFARSLLDVREMRFRWFYVSNLPGGTVYSVTVHLESKNRVVWIEVRRGDAGLVAETILDRQL
jgi:hypothetical protein